MKRIVRWVAYLQAAPLALILGVFLLSADPHDRRRQLLGLRLRRRSSRTSCLTNYADVLGSSVTWKTYLNTLKFAAIVWALTLFDRLLGRLFPRLPRPHAGHADGPVPGLHRAVPDLQHHPHDLVDPGARPQRAAQLDAGPARAHRRSRSNGCSISEFAVVLAMVHLYTLFMVTPIFNTLMRIDRSLIEAARDAGATRLADRCGTSSSRWPSPASRSARSSSSRW